MSRVTIGVPVYNGEEFLGRALETLLAQDYPDFDILISDNASTDSTQAVALRYASADSRIRYVRQPENRGAAANFNFLVREATGEYFVWAAADDEHAPTFLSACLAVLARDPGVVLCYADTVDIDEQGQRLGRYPHRFRTDAPTPHERLRDLVAFDHECFQVFGLMRTAVLRDTRLIGPYADSDRVLLAELALRGRFFEVPEVLFFRRQHSARSTVAYPTSRERVRWFDPTRQGLTWPTWRLGAELVRAVYSAPLPLGERLRCYAELRVWLRANWLRLLKNVARAGLEAPARLRRRAPVAE